MLVGKTFWNVNIWIDLIFTKYEIGWDKNVGSTVKLSLTEYPFPGLFTVNDSTGPNVLTLYENAVVPTPKDGTNDNVHTPEDNGAEDNVIVFVAEFTERTVDPITILPDPDVFVTTNPGTIPVVEETLTSVKGLSEKNVNVTAPEVTGNADKINSVPLTMELTTVPVASTPVPPWAAVTCIPGIIPAVSDTVIVVEDVLNVDDNPDIVPFKLPVIPATPTGKDSVLLIEYPVPFEVKERLLIFPGLDVIVYWNPEPTPPEEELLKDKTSSFK